MHYKFTYYLILILLWPLLGHADLSAPIQSHKQAPGYTQSPATRYGIGKIFMGREISQVMGHRGANWLERDNRQESERTDLLLELLPITPNMTVADIGAGSGYFSLPIAERVTEGKVLAVDIQPEMLALIKAKSTAAQLSNIELILSKEDKPLLPSETVDLALLVDDYHEFEFPFEMIIGIKRGLRAGGKVALVEYRAEDPSVPILRLHKMTADQAITEWEAAGFEFVQRIDDLPQQHMLIFQKPKKR